ncbi:MAG: hypothetical protein ABI840_04635, partial [bacterium]
MAKKQNISSKKNQQLKKVPKESPLYNYSLIFLFSVFIILFTTFKISGDDDIFWHLATGRHIVEAQDIPSTDIFGYVTQGQQWVNVEWGWGVLTFALYEIGGYAAISVLRTIIFLLIFFLLFLILRKFKISFTLIFMFFIILSFGIMDRLSARPHILSYLFLTLLLFIITEYKYFNFNRDKSKSKILFFIPLIFLIWANVHLGVMAGLFLFGIFVLSETIVFFNSGKFTNKEIAPLTKKDLQKLILIFIISMIAILINPFTYLPYYGLFFTSNFESLKSLNEWKSPFDIMFKGRLVILIYKTFLFAGIIILYYSYKKKDLFS